MWGCADDEALWKDKRDKMCAKWTFATEALATSYGVTVHGPFMEPAFVEWAIQNTDRYITLKHTAPYRNTLQRTATHCNTLLHAATQIPCNTL